MLCSVITNLSINCQSYIGIKLIDFIVYCYTKNVVCITLKML